MHGKVIRSPLKSQRGFGFDIILVVIRAATVEPGGVNSVYENLGFLAIQGAERWKMQFARGENKSPPQPDVVAFPPGPDGSIRKIRSAKARAANQPCCVIKTR